MNSKPKNTGTNTYLDKYVPLYKDDNTSISIELVNISCSVELHKHDFFELFLIETGSCKHFFNDYESLLIPGDCFLVPANNNHSFTVHKNAQIFNCQFYPEKIKGVESDILSMTKMLNKKFRPRSANLATRHQANINEHSIIHLNANDFSFLLSIFYRMLEEQTNQGTDFKIIKQNCFQLMLLILKRVSDRQLEGYPSSIRKHQAFMKKALSYIDANVMNNIDLNDIMNESEYFSPNHFRKIFKDFTGLTPVDYTNRLRIVKACGYMENTDIPLGDVGVYVGILDANYFSRLFKSYMGLTPRQYAAYFKASPVK